MFGVTFFAILQRRIASFTAISSSKKSGSDWQTSSGRESLQVHSSQSLRHDLGPFPFLRWIRCA